MDEVPLPVPGPGEVRMAVKAAGVNFADTERRRGLYGADAPLPYTLGYEAAGVVDAIGPGVDPGWRGRRVVWLGAACQAQCAVAETASVQVLPPAVDFATAAALPVQGLTAWHLLHQVGRVHPGMRVLVHSAAGGVGTLLVQLASGLGAEVLAVVGSEAKADLPRRLGARHVFAGPAAWRSGSRPAAGTSGPAGGSDLVAWVKHVTDGEGVALALDGVGRDTLADSLAALVPFGQVVLYGTASGPAPAVDPEALFARSLTVTSYWLRTPHPPGAHAKALAALLEEVESGRLVPQLDSVPPLTLDAAREAHRRLEGRATTGKVVLTLD